MEALCISYADSFACAAAGGKPASNQATAAFAARWDNSPLTLLHGSFMSPVPAVGNAMQCANVSLAVDVLRHSASSSSQTFMGSEFFPGTPGFPVNRAAPNFRVPKPLPTRPPASCQNCTMNQSQNVSDYMVIPSLAF